MRNLTTPARRLRLFPRLSIALLVLTLAAGCRGTQSAYHFKPAAQPVTAASAVAPDSGAAPAVLAAPSVPTASAARLAASRPAWQPRRQQLRHLVAQVQAASSQGVQRVVPAAARHGAQQAARPQQPTEVGLGTTVLGVLGLVVLPISLLGLLIWGGPVWAILAGLAALAVLIAYLDPFG